MKNQTKSILEKNFPFWLLNLKIKRLKPDYKKPGLFNINLEEENNSTQYLLRIWKPLLDLFLNDKKNEEKRCETKFFKNLKNLNHLKYFESFKGNMVLINFHGGDFIIINFNSRGIKLDHKSIHKYVVRKKQGKKQGKQGKKAGTAGSQMRLLMEKQLGEEIEHLLKVDFVKAIKESYFIGLITQGHSNFHLLKKILKDYEEKIISLPFNYKKANFTNSKDAFEKLVRIVIKVNKGRYLKGFDSFFAEKKKLSIKIPEVPKRNKVLDALFYTPLSAISSAVSSLSSIFSTTSPGDIFVKEISKGVKDNDEEKEVDIFTEEISKEVKDNDEEKEVDIFTEEISKEVKENDEEKEVEKNEVDDLISKDIISKDESSGFQSSNTQTESENDFHVVVKSSKVRKAIYRTIFLILGSLVLSILIPYYIKENKT